MVNLMPIPAHCVPELFWCVEETIGSVRSEVPVSRYKLLELAVSS